MIKLEVFDPAMCCSTGICGNSVDPTLVTFASDLEWLKKQGVDVVRYGLSFEPAEFVKNEAVKTTLQCEGNVCLPIIVIGGEIISKASYPSRAKLAEMSNIEYNQQEAPPIHREENCCCGVDCDCSHIQQKVTNDYLPELDCASAPAEDNCCCGGNCDSNSTKQEKDSSCGPECDCHNSVLSNKSKIILFIIVLLIMAGIVAVKFCCKAGAAEVKKGVQTISTEKFTENITSLGQLSTSQGVAFIYIPTIKNEKISNKIKAAMLSAQSTLKSKNIIASLYTINPKSLEYPQIASKTTPPAILTLYKGKSKNYVSGAINPTRLLQSYMASTQEGACGAGCPCHKK